MFFPLSLPRMLRTGAAHILRALLPVLLLVAITHCAHAAGEVPTFEQANKLYEQGKFRDATAAFEAMIAAGQASAAVHYNLGNAYFKDGQLGRAIFHYRHAEWLKPRDPDLKANLHFARKTASGATPEEPNVWADFIGKLNLNEWTVLTLLAWWAWLGLLAAVLWRPELRVRVRGYSRAALVLALLFGMFTWFSAQARFQDNPAVVITKEAVVRFGPLPESRSFYTLQDGAELHVLDQKGEWMQVSDTAQRMGWLRQEQVMLLNAKPVTNVQAAPKPSA